MLGAPRPAPRSPRPGSAVSGQFQRHLASPSSGLSEGISQHTPPAQNVAYPTQLSAAPAPFFPLPVHQRPGANPGLGRGKLLEGRVGTNTRVFQGGREGNTPNEMNPPPGRRGSQGGGAAPPPRGSITTVFLPAPYCSHFARTRNLAQRKETGARRFGWLPAILLSHRARRVLGACEGTRARTRAHTLGSLDHALLALRPSALPPVKTRRSTLPSLRALGQKQALQLTSNLANKNK